MTPDEYKTLRKRIGTQAEVAVLLGLDRGTLARRETGVLPIPQEAQLAIRFLSPAKEKSKKVA